MPNNCLCSAIDCKTINYSINMTDWYDWSESNIPCPKNIKLYITERASNRIEWNKCLIIDFRPIIETHPAETLANVASPKNNSKRTNNNIKNATIGCTGSFWKKVRFWPKSTYSTISQTEYDVTDVGSVGAVDCVVGWCETMRCDALGFAECPKNPNQIDWFSPAVIVDAIAFGTFRTLSLSFPPEKRSSPQTSWALFVHRS